MRRQLEITQKEFSELFEIPIDVVKSWDSGRRKPPAWAEKLIVKELERMKKMKGLENGKLILCNEDDIEWYIDMLNDYTHKEGKDFSDCMVFNMSSTNPYTEDYSVHGIEGMARELSERIDNCQEVVVVSELHFIGKNKKTNTLWEMVVDKKETMKNLLFRLGLPFQLLECIIGTKGQ